jgi:error-prone DNA polymerase
VAKGLANADGACIVVARADQPFAAVDELWRRAAVPVAALERLAEADAFGALSHDRRQALWAIRALRYEPLPLFAAADAHANRLLPEIVEPTVDLVPMAAGREVVEDYQAVGLTLRRHPVAFLRDELSRQRVIPCAELATTRDGRRVTVAGIVLVRQRPGSARGVLFITVEDETGTANLIVWPSLFDRQRRIVLSAGMLACRGRVQKEGEVIHVISDHLTDLSPLLRSVGGRDDPFPLDYGRGDQPTHASGPDPREGRSAGARKPRDIYIPDLRLSSGIIPGQPRDGIKIKPRDFR